MPRAKVFCRSSFERRSRRSTGLWLFVALVILPYDFPRLAR